MAPTLLYPWRICAVGRLFQLIAWMELATAAALLLCTAVASGTPTNQHDVCGSTMDTPNPEPALDQTAQYLCVQMEPKEGDMPASLANVLDARTEIHACSGVHLYGDMVATLASCVDQTTADKAHPFPVVVLGSNAVDGRTPEAGFARVCEQRIHYLYDGDPANGFNIALLKLNSTFRDLSTLDTIAPAVDCTTTMDAYGWPATGCLRTIPESGQVTGNLTLIPDAQCRRWLGKLPKTDVCTMLPAISSNPWDFGSPLFCADHLVGLASHQRSNTSLHVGLEPLTGWLKSKGAGQSRVQFNNHPDCHFSISKDEL
eukprot:evm.model.scf_643.5 EVM.evm.TU.scf_643.5   scf_643:47616-50883(+)